MPYDLMLNYSLNELNNQNVIKNPFPSTLADRCAIACNKKLKDISIDEIRMLVGQSIGLEYIIPLALSFLEKEPLINAGMYKGDLLSIVLDVSDDFWKKNPTQNNRLAEIRISVEELHKTISEEIMPRIVKIHFVSLE
jgi:hypothetical protein